MELFLLTFFICLSFIFGGDSTCSCPDSEVLIPLSSLTTTFLTVFHLSVAVGRDPVRSKTLSEVFAVNLKLGTEGSAARAFMGCCTLPHLDREKILKYDSLHGYLLISDYLNGWTVFFLLSWAAFFCLKYSVSLSLRAAANPMSAFKFLFSFSSLGPVSSSICLPLLICSSLWYFLCLWTWQFYMKIDLRTWWFSKKNSFELLRGQRHIDTSFLSHLNWSMSSTLGWCFGSRPFVQALS